MHTSPPSLLHRNLSLLEQLHPGVYAAITGTEQKAAGEVVFSPTGRPNLQIRAEDGGMVVLHSMPEPDEESPAYLERVQEEAQGVVIMIGMGLGYTPLRLVQERPLVRKFIFFEPDPGIFRQALASLDLSPLLTDPRVALNIGTQALDNIEQALAPAGKELQLENAHILRHLPSFSLGDAYEALNQKIFNHANLLNVSGATILKQARNFLTNRFDNFTILQHHRITENLAGQFAGMPVILVAAGPSLDTNIHLLPAYQDKALIMAVDTALPALLAHGVFPHFVAAIDGDEVIYEKIADSARSCGDICLLCQCHVTGKLAKTFPASRIFWDFTNNSVESWVYRSMFPGQDIKKEIGAWSVAHFNFAVALHMEASPIVIIGQDLAYTGMRDHAGHTILTDSQHMEKLLKEQNDDLVWVDDWSKNGKVPTSRGYYGVKLFFEEIIAKHPQRLFINATEGGAHLEGARHEPLASVLAQYCQSAEDIRPKIRRLVAESPPLPVKQLVQEVAGMAASIQALREQVQKTSKAVGAAEQHLNKLLRQHRPCRQFADLPRPLQQAIQKMEDCNTEVERAGYIWFMLSDLTLTGLKESERLKHDISMLEGKPARYLDWIQLSFQRSKLIDKTRLEALDFFGALLARFLRFQETEAKLQTAPDAGLALAELARFYCNNGYLALAAPLVTRLLDTQPDNPEFLFLKGCIASEQRDETQCAALFAQALALDPGLEQKIRAFRTEQGNAFLRYAEEYRKFDQGTFEKMLFKGLRFCPDHPELLENIREAAERDLADITPDNLPGKKPLIEAWQKALAENEHLEATLQARAAAFYHHYGCLLARDRDYHGARTWIGKALAMQPDDAAQHASMTSVLFDLGEFAEGLTHLKKAVALDRSYGRIWEEIGDSLHGQGQHEDAIAAYEQGFVALPAQGVLLRKMGDCYRALGQLEAAQAAYEQFKRRTQS